MPRYDYKCEAKGHVFEVTQSFTDDPVAFCPEDGSKAERQLSIPHVIYKGSGFYTTDYKNNSNSSSGSSTTGENGKSESGSIKPASSSTESSGSGSNGNSESSSSSSNSSESSAPTKPSTDSAKS